MTDPTDRTGAAGWQLRLLGDVTLAAPRSAPLRLPSRPAAALLARLALAPGRAHPREELVELLWPGVALDVGRNRLRQVLSTLRSLLEPPGAAPVLQADRLALRLLPGRLDCDVPEFEAAVLAGRHALAAACYRGELMPGYFDEWIAEERLRLAALADRLATGAAATAMPTAPAHQAIAAHLAPSALQAHLAPEPGAPAHTGPHPPPEKPPAGACPALPRYLTLLHGVGEVGAALCDRVLGHRLVTLLGPGGHGKTRLAVAVAQALGHGEGPLAASPAGSAPRFDMVAFVPLVACSSRDEMLDALLLALHQEAHAAGGVAHLVDVLAGRRALLVLDNLEQLTEAAAPLVAALLEACPQLHLLVTSRRLLELDGEQAFVLPPLPLPGPQADAEDAARNPAVALFIDRARAARADFHLSARNREAVVALVRRLEGMPLAIELAASRVRSLPPAQLLMLLEEVTLTASSAASPAAPAGLAAAVVAPAHPELFAPGPADPVLALLARSGPRGGSDPRHASMLSVIDWSWRLLSPEARRLFVRLSVFAGGCSVEAAHAVCGEGSSAATALALDELVVHSMLRSDPASGRLEPYALLRLQAAAGLPAEQAPALRARLRRWLIDWARALPAGAPLTEVRHELGNIAAALGGAADDGAPADAAALVEALQGPLSDISLPPAAMRALARCADALDDPAQRSLTRTFLARALFRAGDPAAAAPLAAQALAELPPADWQRGQPRAWVLARLAHLRWRLARDPAVAAWLAEALALAEAAGAPALMASVLATQGALARPRDRVVAIALQRRSLALWQAAADPHGTHTGEANLAIALAESPAGCAEALALLDTMLAGTHASGDWVQHAHGLNVRGEALARLRRWPEAIAAYRDCVRVAFALPEMLPLAYGLWNGPRALAHLGAPLSAARLMGFAERFALRHSGPPGAVDRHELRRVRRLCQVGWCRRHGAMLPPMARAAQARRAVAQAWAEGAEWPLAQAVRRMLEEGAADPDA